MVLGWRAAFGLVTVLSLAACQSLPGADGRYADSDNGFRATLSVGSPLRSM
jgi:predicted MFS family arabinose efflux permease